MGDDFYNPFTSKQYLEPIPFWETVLGIVLAVALGLGAVWAVAVILFSLDRM